MKPSCLSGRIESFRGATRAWLPTFFGALMMASSAWAMPVAISFGEEISGEISAGEEPGFQIEELVSGQRVYVQQTVSSNRFQLNWLLEDTSGRVIDQNSAQLDDLGPVSLMGGDYTLTERGETPTAAGTFSFIVHKVDDTASTLALDTVDTRSLSGVGATHAFDPARRILAPLLRWSRVRVNRRFQPEEGFWPPTAYGFQTVVSNEIPA